MKAIPGAETVAVEPQVVRLSDLVAYQDGSVVSRQLRLDHSALVTLLVPTPTHEIVAEIRRVLASHNRLEEDEGGMYDEVDRLLTPAEAEVLVEDLRATPDPAVAPYFDEPRVHARIAQLLRDARRGR